jgi:hypothetical protein
MNWLRHLWIPLIALAIALPGVAAAKDKPKKDKKAEEKIRWVFVNYRQFQVEMLIGNLSSCLFRALKDGGELVMTHGDKIQVTATRKEGKVDIAVRVNEKHLPTFSAEMMEKGLEEAITQCFTEMTGEEEGEEHLFVE